MNPRQYIFFTLAKATRSKRREYLAGFGSTWPLKSPPSLCFNRLALLLSHSAANVPYYKSRVPDVDIATLGHGEVERVLRELPIMTKETIRAQGQNLISDDAKMRKTYFNTSGGSTGEPIKLLQDWDYHEFSMAMAWLACQEMGYSYGQPKVYVWGSERDILKGSEGFRAKFFRKLENARYLNAFMMKPEEMRGFLSEINRKPAKIIIAYAQALFELAQFAEAKGIDVVPQGAITTSAGTLYPQMRSTIERVFKCPVYNWYGSREVSLIATELPGRKGLWVPPWAQYIEIVDEANKPCRPGQVGSILVTCLANFAMPLIRYKIGDRAMFADSNEGQQVLQGVVGREVDAFRRADGTLVDGEYFTHLLYHKPWVKQFQFIQETFTTVTLKIVSNSPQDAISPLEMTELLANVKAVLGPDAEIKIEWVSEIPPSSSGKYRYTLSNVKGAL